MNLTCRVLTALTPTDLIRQEAALNLDSKILFKRYFLSEASQAKELPEFEGARSVVVQPPLGGAKIALWLILGDPDAVVYENGITRARIGETELIFSANYTAPRSDSAIETTQVLDAYTSFLESNNLTLEANCVRTWFFCDDIDRNYAGLVSARKDHFVKDGLTKDTHYIASTGIAGAPSTGATVQLDALAVRGPFTQRYLYAPTHLNPTWQYGVTFERGVRLDIGQDSLTLISGTASIDNRGEVVHVGDVAAQTARMFENVEALLSEAGESLSTIKHCLVYLREPSDYEIVKPLLDSKLGSVPYLVLHAPVCRPTWLIEMECFA